jgi:sortase A
VTDELDGESEETTPRAKMSRWDRPKEPHDWRWVVGGIGRTLITIGLLLFAFVGYQLWGTGIQTAQAQNRLANQFDQQLAAAVTTSSTTSTTIAAAPGSTVPEVPENTTPTTQPLPIIGRPTLGDPVARLDIPSIGLDGKIVIEGVRVGDLQDGPGHFPETPLPGQFGNAAIAGHRTTHGQPFFRIDEIAPGDEIVVTTLAGRYVYIVTESIIVGPDDYSKVIPTIDPSLATLTLTSCHPKFSAKQRIVVTAEVDLDQSDVVTASFGSLDDGSSGGGVPDPSFPPESVPGTAATSSSATVTSIATTTTSTDASPSLPAEDLGSGDGGGSAASEELFANRWFSDSGAYPHVLVWGLLLAAIAFGSARLARRLRNLWIGVLVGFVPFLVVLYFWFENVARMLPPNF